MSSPFETFVSCSSHTLGKVLRVSYLFLGLGGGGGNVDTHWCSHFRTVICTLKKVHGNWSVPSPFSGKLLVGYDDTSNKPCSLYPKLFSSQINYCYPLDPVPPYITCLYKSFPLERSSTPFNCSCP